MDPKFKEILDSLPNKPPRSRLQPYWELIRELRRRGQTFQDIAHILAEKCQVQVTASAVHDFVRKRFQAKRRPGKRRNSRKDERKVVSATPRINTGAAKSASAPSSTDEVAWRIAALKARKPDAAQTSERFHFDVTEPLRLKKSEKRKSE